MKFMIQIGMVRHLSESPVLLQIRYMQDRHGLSVGTNEGDKPFGLDATKVRPNMSA